MSVRQELEIRRLRRDLARSEKACRSMKDARSEVIKALYVAEQRIEWLQEQIENQDDVKRLLGWLEETT